MRLPVFAIAAVVSCLSFACHSETQSIKFPVTQKDGKVVEVDRFYGWSASGTTAANRAFALLEQGKVEDAFTVMKEKVDKDPSQPNDHFDLAIIYEIKADWKNALAEIETAQKPPNEKDSNFVKEHEFIQAHLP